ncbi:MAG: hypothetical protein OIN66_17915 [Candidatus Methanoperedens sp.]|nr:hypothetical protein [Candidatus Methanoperedens sp.]
MSEEKNVDKGISALQKALKDKNVKVDAKVLKEAVAEAHKAAIVGCEGCANGWHW